MQNTWNFASSRVTLLTLILLLPVFGASTNAQAKSSSTKQSNQATSQKALGAKAVKPVIVKKAGRKSSVIVARRNVKAPNGKASNVKANAEQSHVVHRQNLRTVAYTSGSAHSQSVSQLQASLPSPDSSDIIIRRDPPSHEIEPLTNQAMLRSEVAFVQDLDSATVLYDKNSDEVRPIASISKLMTALVVAEAGLPMNETMQISDADVDRLRHSRSRLPVGTELTRADMLHLALMSSENRAAHALGRYYPGGLPAFVRAMNDKARSLGMRSTRFVEPTGLSSENVSTPRDLVQLLRAASKQPLIHRYTTDDQYEIAIGRGRQLVYNNTNRLVKNADWDIKVSKTGFINEAGECLVMLTRIDNRNVAIVLLNSTGRYSRIGDAVRVRTLVENGSNLAML